jgi:ribosomal protein S18 acetylase RimI-like enzyme
MAGFTVRAARPADHLALAALLAELLERPRLSAELEAALNTNLLRLLSTPGSTLLVAEGDMGVVGFVSLWTRWGLLDQAPAGFIDRIVVRADLQEKAVPHALLEQALGACQAMGCSEVEFVPAEGSLVPELALKAFGFEKAEGRYSLTVL